MLKLILIPLILHSLTVLATEAKMVNEHIVGSYKLEKSENFDEFMKQLGIGFLKRQAASIASATVDISVDGDNWNIKTTSTFKNSELKFKLGEEFDEERQDGAKVKSTFTLEDNVLTQVQKGGSSDVTLVRTFNADGMTLVAETNGVKSTRTYSRIKK